MRILVLILCGIAGLSTFSFGQQNSEHPKKVLTPEQRAYQEQMREIQAQRDVLRAQAQQAFNAEMARGKTTDCDESETTNEVDICYSKAVKITDQNLKTYEDAIHGILGLKYPGVPGQLSYGPSGPILTPEEEAAEFDHSEQLWHTYLESATTSARHQFGGGTGAPGFEMETHLRLVRSHMKELDGIYGLILHN